MVKQQGLWMGIAQRHQVRAVEETLGEDPLLERVAWDILCKECHLHLGKSSGKSLPCTLPLSSPSWGFAWVLRGSSALWKVTEPPLWLVGLHLLL